MLAVLILAGLFPNTSAVQAQTNCPYGGCTTTSSFPTWELVSILVVIAAAAIATALFLMRRRRQQPPAASVPAGQGGPPAGAAGGLAAPAAPTPPYIETPEDVGHAMPTVPVSRTATAAGAAGAEGEPDIDSLMAELDKISGEILKKPPKKGAGTQDAAEDEDKAA